jgi:hypothetical protein
LALEMAEKALNGQLGIDGGAFGGEGKPLGAGTDIPDGELIFGKPYVAGLRPITRLVAEVFDVDLKPLEGAIALLDFAQVVLLLILLSGATSQLVLAQDTANSREAAGELELVHQALCTKAGALSSGKDLALDFGCDAPGRIPWPAGVILQSFQPRLTVSPNPEAHRIARDGEMPSCGPKAMMPGIAYQDLPQIKGRLARTDHRAILPRAQHAGLLGLSTRETSG